MCALRPHHMGAIVEVSRNMLQHIDARRRGDGGNDLAPVLARGVDAAAIQGAGDGDSATRDYHRCVTGTLGAVRGDVRCAGRSDVAARHRERARRRARLGRQRHGAGRAVEE